MYIFSATLFSFRGISISEIPAIRGSRSASALAQSGVSDNELPSGTRIVILSNDADTFKVAIVFIFLLISCSETIPKEGIPCLFDN